MILIAVALIDLCYFHCFACVSLGLVNLTLRNAPIPDRWPWLLGLLLFSFLSFFPPPPRFKIIGKFSVEVREETSSLPLKLFNGGKKRGFLDFSQGCRTCCCVGRSRYVFIYRASLELISFAADYNPCVCTSLSSPSRPLTCGLHQRSLTHYFFFPPISLPLVHLLPPRLLPEMRSDTVPGRRA